MIVVLINLLDEWLIERGLFGFVRVFTYPEFRAIAALLFSFAFVLVLGPRTIRWLVRMKIGDSAEFNHANLNAAMRQKRNTPTMGGILICGAIFTATVLLADVSSFYVRMALICLTWLAAVGAADDWLKLTNQRRGSGTRDGLHSHEKLLFQVGLAVLLGLYIHHWGQAKASFDIPEMYRMSHSLTLPFLKTWQRTDTGGWIPSDDLITLGPWMFVILCVLVITGSSNAVNLTDGMDGLAAGVTGIVAFAFMILALIAGTYNWATYLLVPYIQNSDELAVIAGSIVGSCLGFLWFNCSPAQVFMGDTGSLALGGLLGYIAVVIRQEFLLMIIGGIFVLEAVSVIMQVGYFKATGGKRIFRTAPIHHHFHLGGWGEQQVVIRFWLVTVVLAAVAMATIKLR